MYERRRINEIVCLNRKGCNNLVGQLRDVWNDFRNGKFLVSATFLISIDLNNSTNHIQRHFRENCGITQALSIIAVAKWLDYCTPLKPFFRMHSTLRVDIYHVIKKLIQATWPLHDVTFMSLKLAPQLSKITKILSFETVKII